MEVIIIIVIQFGCCHAKIKADHKNDYDKALPFSPTHITGAKLPAVMEADI
jgi:hypothetical protein